MDTLAVESRKWRSMQSFSVSFGRFGSRPRSYTATFLYDLYAEPRLKGLYVLVGIGQRMRYSVNDTGNENWKAAYVVAVEEGKVFFQIWSGGIHQRPCAVYQVTTGFRGPAIAPGR